MMAQKTLYLFGARFRVTQWFSHVFPSMRRRHPLASTGTAHSSPSAVVLCCVLLHISTTLGIVELPHPVGKKLLGHRWTVTSYGLEVSAFQVVVSNEEVLDLVQVLCPQV